MASELVLKPAIEIVNEIDAKSKELYNNLDDSETISKTLFELAILSVGLGNHLIEALDRERQLESSYKYKIDVRVLEGVEAGEAVNKSELKARKELNTHKDNWLEAKRQVDILKIKRADLEKVIDTGRSRLSLIKNDMRKDI